MTLVKDDKSPNDLKSKPERRKEKMAPSAPSGQVENLKKSEEILEENPYLSGPSSGVREGFNKNQEWSMSSMSE